MFDLFSFLYSFAKVDEKLAYGAFISWRDIYKLEPRIKDANCGGGQTCMVSGNKQDLDQKVWMKISVINELLQSVNINGTKNIFNIAQRLSAQMRRVKHSGPNTLGLCKKNSSRLIDSLNKLNSKQ